MSTLTPLRPPALPGGVTADGGADPIADQGDAPEVEAEDDDRELREAADRLMRDVAARHDAAIASGVPESEVWIATAEDMTDLVVDLLRVQRQQMRARAFAEHGALLDRIAEAEHRAEVAEREHRMLQRHHELTLSGRLGVRNMIALTVARDRVVEALSAKLDAAERDVDRLLAAIEKMENTK